MNVLLIEDSVQLADAIKEYFRINNVDMDIVTDGKKGLETAQQNRYDAIVLDVMLPSMDGFSILRRLRENGLETPIIILTAKAQENDVLTGFGAGADDYLTKPFNMSELLARVNAIVKRQGGAARNVLEYNDISLDKSTHELCCGTQRITLSPREYEIMRNLIEKRGGLVGKELLDERVWGYSGPNMYNGVEVYVSFLRKKLKSLDAKTEIRVLRGSGYRLAPMGDTRGDTSDGQSRENEEDETEKES